MVKKILIFLLLGTCGTLTAQEIQWMSMTEALEAQKEQPKKIFMDAYTTWCGPCKMLDRNTFSNQDVINFINENYYPVKFNAEGDETVQYRDRTFANPEFKPKKRGRNSPHEFSRFLKIRGYPSLVFFDEAGNSIAIVPGYQDPHDLELLLKLFTRENYEELIAPDEFREYASQFENEFDL